MKKSDFYLLLKGYIDEEKTLDDLWNAVENHASEEYDDGLDQGYREGYECGYNEGLDEGEVAS